MSKCIGKTLKNTSCKKLVVPSYQHCRNHINNDEKWITEKKLEREQYIQYQKDSVKNQLQGSVYASDDGAWVIDKDFPNRFIKNLKYSDDGISVYCCWCTGCMEYRQYRAVDAINCKNMRNSHCLFCKCKWCVCPARRAAGMYSNYVEIAHWDNMCSWIGCPSCDITKVGGDSLSNIPIQNYSKYIDYIENQDTKYILELKNNNDAIYDSCIPVQRANIQSP